MRINNWTFWVYIFSFLISYSILERFWLALGTAVSIFVLSMIVDEIITRKLSDKLSKKKSKR